MPAGPSCPRCAYDLSGVIATWDAACPLTGTCSECGLEFAWVDVFRPDRERLKGFFEHANTIRRGLRWTFETLWWVIRPWYFWRRVTLFVRPRPGRVLVWIVLLVAALHASASLLRSTAAVTALVTFPTVPPPPTPLQRAMPALVSAWGEPVVRVTTWSFGPGPPAWLWEWDPRGYARGAFIVGVGCLTWPVMFFALGETLRRCRVSGAHLVRGWGYSLAWLACVILVDGAATLVGLVLGTLEIASGRSTANAWWYWHDGLGLLTLAAAAVWIPLWWWFAINRGFRLRHGPVVWLAFLGASLLVMANAALLPTVLQSWLRFAV